MRKVSYVVISLLLFGACVPSQYGETENSTMSLRIGVMMVLDSFPIIIAEERGFFYDEGLVVTLDRFTSGVERDIAFQVNDDMDGLMLDMIGLAMFSEGGVEKIMLTNTIGIAAVLGATGIAAMEDLKGGTVLAARNSAMDYILYVALIHAGIPEDEINFVEIPAVPTRMEMLLGEQAEGALLPEPFLTLANQQGAEIIADTRGLGVNPFGITVRRSTAEENGNALLAFIRALDRAVDYINSSPRDEVMDLLIELAGFPEALRGTFNVPVFPKFTSPSADALDSAFEFSRHRGILAIPLRGEDVLIDLGF